MVNMANIKDEHVKIALNVSGYHPILKFDDDIFLMDYWSEDEGLKYLIGIAIFTQSELIDDFSDLTTLEFETYDSFDDEDILLAFRHFWHRINRLWLSNSHPRSNPPSYYIDWALSKNIEIPWLNYAIEKGFYVQKSSKNVIREIDKPLSTRTKNNYLRLIFALANGLKGFNPKKPHEAANLIINETGIENISAETIAGYISEAYELESKNRE